MAPEVYHRKPYGFAADVYSFGLLLWNLCSLKTPFGKYISLDKLESRVMIKGERPSPLSFVSDRLNLRMSQCWDSIPSKRPSFENICATLSLEVQDEMPVGHLLDRTNHMIDDSIKSRTTRLPCAVDSSSMIIVPRAA